MTPVGKTQTHLKDDIVGHLARQHSTATVLFHHTVAERLGLGPTDHKCLDVVRGRQPMTGSELAAITGLTTGAITGVVSRLEQIGYLRRHPDPHDRRKQHLVPIPERVRAIHDVIAPLRNDMAAMLERFDDHQLAAVAEFLARSTEITSHHAALLRVQTRSTQVTQAHDTPTQDRR